MAKSKIFYGSDELGWKLIIDAELNPYSSNPIQNGVVAEAVANCATKQDLENATSQTVTLRGTAQLDVVSGTLTEEEMAKLLVSNLSQIIFQNNFYKLAYKESGILMRYATPILTNNGCTQVITIIPSTREWIYSLIGNQAFIEHVNDEVKHITAEERAKWNNKVTCYLDPQSTTENGKLVLTKEDIRL